MNQRYLFRINVEVLGLHLFGAWYINSLSLGGIVTIGFVVLTCGGTVPLDKEVDTKV